MKDEDKTKEQLINELVELRQRITELKASKTERKKAEERVLRQRALLDGINRVFHETLTCETAEEVARTCLAVAEELTGSKFGWIGEVNQAGRLDTIALSDPGWEACRMPRSDAVVMIKDMEIRGIWGRVLKDERSLIVNDPASYHDRVGTPEGHPPLTSFLGVPLKHAGRAIGMFALGNKESGYDLADQQDMEAMSVAFVEALDRKRAEEALRESEEKFRHLSEEISEGIAVTIDGKNYWVNKAFSDIFGYTQEELIGKGVDFLIVPEEVPLLIERMKARLAGKDVPSYYETIAKRKDGKRINVDVSAKLITFEGKRAIQIVVRDITERKRAEQELQKQHEEIKTLKEFNEKIVQSMQEGVVIEDENGVITYLNPQAEKMLGYTKEELIGEHWSKITSKRYMKKARKETAQRPRGIASRYECEIVTKSGEIVPIINSATPLFEEGEFKGVLSVFTDISGQKEKEEKLRKKFMKYRLDWGSIYYADEVKLERGLNAFIDILDLSYSGAVVSRAKPDELEAKIAGKAPVLWLSKKAHKASVPPSLSTLAEKIEELLTERRVILFQGLEYLMSKNGFKNTLKFLQDLNELIYTENAIMILSLDSRALNERQLALVQKEVLPLILKREKEMPERCFALLKFVYEQNVAGVKPSHKDVCRHFGITRNTARNRIKYLTSRRLLLTVPKGRSKVLELTELGKEYL